MTSAERNTWVVTLHLLVLTEARTSCIWIACQPTERSVLRQPHCMPSPGGVGRAQAGGPARPTQGDGPSPSTRQGVANPHDWTAPRSANQLVAPKTVKP